MDQLDAVNDSNNSDTGSEDEGREWKRFDFQFNRLQSNVKDNTQYEFQFDFQKNAVTSFDKLRSFVELWAKKLIALKLNTKQSTSVFQLVINLVDELTIRNVELLRDSENEMSAEYITTVSSDLLKSELSLYTTTYRANKTLSSDSMYVHPEERAIGTRMELKRDKTVNIAIPRLVQSPCQYIRISDTLVSLFKNVEFTNMYFKHNTERHLCVGGQYKDFCCGDIYKESSIFSTDPYAIQLQIFTDDFEPCNPLQSKAGVHKMTAVYFLIKNVPLKLHSKLNYIQLVCLAYSDDINKSTQADFNNIWQLIIEDVSKLETEGINIGSRKLKASICYPSFDNLGANVSLGFAGSFSADFFCRFCECSSQECGTITEEIEAKNRSKENYESRLRIIESLDKIDYRKTCGIKRDCLLNELKDFHVTSNISADILHDIYEGAMPFVLQHLIEFMTVSKILKKNEIIQLVQFYDFGEKNRTNVPSVLSLAKSNLGQNGAQVKCLFHHFPFILSKFKYNEKLKSVWNSMESLARISEVIHSFHLTTDDLIELKMTVSTLLNSIQANFKVKLIPKLHNLVHYARIIKSMGPIAHMNVQRFESKHKMLKQIIIRSPSYVNACKTIAIPHQQHICTSDLGLKDEISCGIKHLIKSEMPDEEDELFYDFLTDRVVYETKYLCFNNFKYKKTFCY